MVDDTAILLGGTQAIVACNEYTFPPIIKNGLCHLEQRIPSDEEMHSLPQVVS